jgi:uncharacterized membrane protein
MKISWILKLGLLATAVCGGGETVLADVQYTITVLVLPSGYIASDPTGINNSGQIVGSFGLLDSGGSYAMIDAPGALGTVPYGINDSGQISGIFVVQGLGGPYSQGFLYSGGTFTTLSPGGPEAIAEAYGINDAGQVVGSFQSANVS